MADRDDTPASPPRFDGGPAALPMLGVGVALLAGGALALWRSEGASVFLENAFAAVIACF